MRRTSTTMSSKERVQHRQTGKHTRWAVDGRQEQPSRHAGHPGKQESPRQFAAHVSRGAVASRTRRGVSSRSRTEMSLSSAMEEYLQDHEGGNHSPKTIEWHQTSLGLLCQFLKEKRSTTLVEEVEPADLAAWFTHLRTSRGSHDKRRSERTVQTYARSARAFFHWLKRRGLILENPFDQVAFPKVGRPLIQTITDEEFERLLHACVPGTQTRPLVERMIARNRAILWLFYDSGIRASELLDLRVGDLDRKQGLITVRGKGRKERRIALGQNCLHQVLLYLDGHRPDAEELAQWEAEGEDHLFLSELRQPLTKNGLEMLFARLRKRAGITGKRISPHILRHTFAVRYLILGNDPFSLQQLLGHEDITTVKHYMHMNDDLIQEQKRKYSPGDHPTIALPGIRETRQKGFVARGNGKMTRA